MGMGCPRQGFPWARAPSLSCQGTHPFPPNLLWLLTRWPRPHPDAHSLAPLLTVQGKSPVSRLLPHLAGPRVKDGSRLSFLQMEILGSSDRKLGSSDRVKL